MPKKSEDQKKAFPTIETFSFETVKLDRKGQVIEKLTCEGRQIREDLGRSVSLELVFIPGGSFQMGSRFEGGYEDEQPVHPVFLSEFWLGKAPVTQAQWQAVMGWMPLCRFHGPIIPVETICWKDAAKFCQKLSRMTGRSYDLPSEAQWEYACRAGTATPFNLGENITTDYANYVGLHTYREGSEGVYRHDPNPARTYPPNPWGLYDMHGNLWEFCADSWFDNYNGAPVNGAARLSGGDPRERKESYRVARGGSWHEPPAHCRSAMRLRVEENDRMEYYGFRVMLQESKSG
jgi:formylglycine-generating enzyme required for sulfatase activity